MNLRKATNSDLKKITELYRRSTETPNGLAHTPQEINENCIASFLNNALERGLIFVIEHPQDQEQVVASIHCYKPDTQCFKHVLGNLIIAIHPDFQGQGLGKKIFSHLLDEVQNHHPEIARVELFVRPNNPRGMKLYSSLGFEIEGICKKRILDADGNLGEDVLMAWMNPNFKI